MRLEPPRWWYGSSPSDRLTAALLSPAAWLYGAAGEARFALARPYRSRLPVICIGNFTLGGAGKTPLALALSVMLECMGHRPAFLTRGYGGSLSGPHRVAPERDSAAEVGDEALLLARAAPTVLSRDRPAGARDIEALDATIIIMDDGFQNPSLIKDLAVVAVDGGAGLGNGRVFPAGPLRAPLGAQSRRASLAVVIGGGGAPAPRIDGVPSIAARLEPVGGLDWLRATPVVAFSGIGRPGKFFATLSEFGAELLATEAFPDHHPFTEADAAGLLQRSARQRAALVTTEKDWVRIPDNGELGTLKRAARPLPVALRFTEDGEARLSVLISAMLDRFSAP